METAPQTLTDKLIAAESRVSARNYAPIPVVLKCAEGVFVWDVEDRRYYDMLSAYSAVNQGHQHPKIVEALVQQARTLALTSRAFHNDKMGPWLEKLCALTGFDKALPMNTGAEAVETAIKAMRRWGYEIKKVPKDKAEIIVCADNFHGRTTTIIGFATDPDSYEGYGPYAPGFKVVPYGDPQALEAAIGPHTVGVLMEPIQGEAGVRIPPQGTLKAVREICTRHNVLLCFDEIQTGLGRTGKLFCWQHEDAKPDLMTLGKALSGGLYPISALVARADVMDVFTPGTHGSTYGGNPLAAVISSAALDVLVDEKLAERATTLGKRFLDRLEPLRQLSHIKEIRGRGLLIAIELTTPDAKACCKALAQKGVLAKDTHQTTVRFAPPLIISEEQVDEVTGLICEVFKQIAG